MRMTNVPGDAAGHQNDAKFGVSDGERKFFHGPVKDAVVRLAAWTRWFRGVSVILLPFVLMIMN